MLCGVKVIAHDASRKLKAAVCIGKNCFISLNAIYYLPGVTIGDEVVIGAGAVVSRNIPSHSIAAGNPARVLRKNVRCDKWGVIIDRGELVKVNQNV